MLSSVLEYMKVSNLVVQAVAIDVMHDLPRLCARNLPMLPLSTLAHSAVSKPMRRGVERGRMPMGLFDGGVCNICLGVFPDGRNHLVTSPHMLPMGKIVNLFGVRKQRVTVPVPHLIMAHTEFSGDNWSVAVRARPTHLFTAPSIVCRAVSFGALVMHQTKPIGRVLSATAIYRANSSKWFNCHCKSLRFQFPIIYTYKAIGNVMRWIGQRIDIMGKLIKARAA